VIATQAYHALFPFHHIGGNMKVLLHTAVLAAVVLMLGTSTGTAQFRHGGNWLGPVLTVTDPIGFGAQYEHGISPNIGIGGIIRYWGTSVKYFGGEYSWSVIVPQFQGAYHFMPGDQFDPYAGGRLGWGIYSEDREFGSASASSGLFLTAYGGLRYFFSPKISGNGSLEFRVAGDNYFGSSIQVSVGVDFTL
jgi:hypothetical protein